MEPSEIPTPGFTARSSLAKPSGQDDRQKKVPTGLRSVFFLNFIYFFECVNE